jgi:hypothetical protein
MAHGLKVQLKHFTQGINSVPVQFFQFLQSRSRIMRPYLSGSCTGISIGTVLENVYTILYSTYAWYASAFKHICLKSSYVS